MPVVGFDIDFSRTLADGKSWGDVGPYEEIRGKLRFAIDPLNEFNSRVTDVGLAPRNSDGLVEFSSDVSIILPVDRSKGSGKMMLDVVNRGNRVALPNFNSAERPSIDGDTPIDVPVDLGNGFLMRHGYTVVACGWQVDAPTYPALITMQGQDAAGLTGRVYTQLQSPSDTKNFLLSDKGHKAYPAHDMYEASALLEVREMPDTPATGVDRDSWRFGRINEDGSYESNPNYICSEEGFKKGLLYQIAYTTDWAPVLNLSALALRDCISWLKYDSEFERPIDNINHAYAYGRSQTGRYLRTYIYNDLNRDESGREAMDGIIANVAGGMRGEFNQRFGQNSKDRNNMMAPLFPFAATTQTDIENEETGSLHQRLDDRNSPLKVMYTNSSAEYHRGDASLVHTNPDGNRDAEVGANVRVYHFAGTEHGLGTWPPTDTADPGDGVARSQNLRGVINYAPLLRACLVSLDHWVTRGTSPLPSSHPRVADGTAVPPVVLKKAFDGIPGANYPARHAIPHRRDYAVRDDVEQTTKMPPSVGGAFGTLVSAVDSDGNEVAGVRLPQIAVPLASHTGWNPRHADIGGERQLLMFAGGTIPFPTDEAHRAASGDSRPSIASRYASKEAYLAAIRSEAEKLSESSYMLDEDVDFCVEKAKMFWDYLVVSS